MGGPLCPSVEVPVLRPPARLGRPALPPAASVDGMMLKWEVREFALCVAGASPVFQGCASICGSDTQQTFTVAVQKMADSRNQLWTQEKELMAEFEVALPAGATSINTLTRDNLLPERSLDSIRGARKQPGYKRLLEEKRAEAAVGPPLTAPTAKVPLTPLPHPALASPKAADCILEPEGEAARCQVGV